MDGKSLDLKQQKRSQLRRILPEAFTENKIDWQKLKAALGEDIETNDERYVLNWAGKSDAFRALQTPTTSTLTPCRQESVDFENTGHVFIEGENLEVMKVLQKAYYGRIKMIYIDPPYNTGNDSFIYPDKFSESRDAYLTRVGDKDESGYLTREGLFRKNSRDSGHYHSNWLSMMYPRLFLARNLLRDDGVIFVSIDDNEVHNLRLLMNEVFGEENFIAEIIWKNIYGGGAKSKHVVPQHEYVLCFAKNKELIGTIELPPDPEMRKRYTDRDEKVNTRGPYFTQPLATTSMDDRPNLRYPILWKGENIWPEKQWQWSKERVETALQNDELVIKKNNGKWSVRYKQYLKDENGKERGSKLFSVRIKPWSQEGTSEIVSFFGNGKIFPFPKPSRLVKHLISACWEDNDAIFLDFFAGSCPSAQAVFDLNRENGCNHRFIMIQFPEFTSEDSHAFKAGYHTIAEIGKERIRRVIAKIEQEQAEKQPELFDAEKAKQDLGFKVFKLRPSNFKGWRSDGIGSAEALQAQLALHTEPLKAGTLTEKILYELLLKSGVPLTAKITHEDKIFWVHSNSPLEGGQGGVSPIEPGQAIVSPLEGGQGGVSPCESVQEDVSLALLLEEIDAAKIRTVLTRKPQKAIALDRLFHGNDQLKTNAALQMKDAGIDFRTV